MQVYSTRKTSAGASLYSQYLQGTRPRSAFLEIKRTADKPWWWDQADLGAIGCDLIHEPVVLTSGRPGSVFSSRMLVLVRRCAAIVLPMRRRRYECVFTVEGDFTSFLVAGLQTVFRLRRPRHVIIQFIMRERNNSLRSRLKYAFMRWCFSSVDTFICSSRRECRYYAQAFGWPEDRFRFVTLLTDPQYLSLSGRSEEPFVLSAGRTFRDYSTLLQAFDGLDVNLTIVASRDSLAGLRIPANVSVAYDLPLNELTDLMSRCMAVVLPLEDRQISIGQSVLFQGMAMGKTVIASRVNGTEDYIENMKTGVLVPPNDVEALRTAVRSVVADKDLRDRLGRAAREQVQSKHLPRHYALGIVRAIGRPPRNATAQPPVA